MICYVYNLKENLEFPLINIYGPTKILDKSHVWYVLSNKISDLRSDRIVVVGDFNALLDLDEKKGGLRMSNKVVEDFREFVVQNHLLDVVSKNGLFTWTNQRANFAHILERLDRHLIGESWMESSFQVEASILPIFLSDHFPVELKLSEASSKGSNSFKFLNMWWRDGEFISHLEQWWKEINIFRGTPSYSFVKRLKFLKEKIKVWNKDTFKNIFAERNRVEEELSLLNYVTITSGMSNDAYHKEIDLKKELAEILLREEIYWRDKSRELWIKEGDVNTKFFHASVKSNRNRNIIVSITDQEGKRHSFPEGIEVAVIFFKELSDVNGYKPPQPHMMTDIIFKEISDEDNKLLCCPFTIEEVKKVVFDLHPNKAPSPNGFTVDFFQK
ncbi:hypothetical protein SUGI_0843510 [Cryptomeria japonica]|nr:hypothetical protein SUGI_0843510 [Cryptomeria japonica]